MTQPSAIQEAVLRKLIQKTVAPTTWSDKGGNGTIEYYPIGMALVVLQTAGVHEQIADLLASLRRTQEVEESHEARLKPSRADPGREGAATMNGRG